MIAAIRQLAPFPKRHSVCRYQTVFFPWFLLLVCYARMNFVSVLHDFVSLSAWPREEMGRLFPVNGIILRSVSVPTQVVDCCALNFV